MVGDGESGDINGDNCELVSDGSSGDIDGGIVCAGVERAEGKK